MSDLATLDNRLGNLSDESHATATISTRDQAVAEAERHLGHTVDRSAHNAVRDQGMEWWFEPSRFGAAQLLRRSDSQDLLGQRGKVFLPSIHGYVSHFTPKRKVRMKNTQARTERECSSNLASGFCCLPLVLSRPPGQT
jgi:hypothetical protein